MYCEKCGNKIEDGMKFCPNCGAEILPEGSPELPDEAAEIVKAPEKETKQRQKSAVSRDGKISGEKVTENIRLCPDGKYRWIYEYPMLKNPTILFTVWNVLGIAGAILYVIYFFTSIGDNIRYGWGDFLSFSWKYWLFLIAFMVIIGGIGYLVLASFYGWKYMVLFEMDEEKVVHTQMAKQFKKAEALGWLTALAGMAGGNLTTAGIGINTSVRSRSSSDLKYVKEVKVQRGLHTIKLNQGLDHNQVYADGEDFDFVLDFIREHCPNAKIKE